MRAIALTGIGRLEVVERERPELRGDLDVLLDVEVVGVCGSDVHYYRTGRIGSQVVEYPMVLGHELAGRVAAVGRKVRRVRVGELVAVDPAMACLECDQCRAGREHTCRSLRFLGCPGQAEGCLCEQIVMPEHCLYPVGESVTAEQAALVEPFSIGLYAVRLGRLRGDDSIAVFGSGPIGLSVVLAARVRGPVKAYATDRVSARVAKALEAGAAWAGNPDEQDVVAEVLGRCPAGVDVAFECAGQQETLEEALEVLRPGGTLVLVGIPEFERFSLRADQMRRKEITLVNVRRQNRCVGEALELVGSGRVSLDFLVTHRFGLSGAAEAFALVSGYGDGVVKAMVAAGG